MPEKKILLVGDGNHQFIVNLAKQLKNNKKKLIIGVISHTDVSKNNSIYYDVIISPHNLKLYGRLFSKIKYIRSLIKRIYYFTKRDTIISFDIINFHYLTSDSFAIRSHVIRKFKGKIIYSIWGSDMYKIRGNQIAWFKKNIVKADSITFTNEKSIEYFEKTFNLQKLDLQLCRFGLAPLENLKKLSLSKANCKEDLKWAPEKFAVTVGYNLAPGQQHLKILEQFKDEEILKYKDKIQIILPVTYGGSQSYKNEIIEKLENLPFDYKIYDQFLDDDLIAKIRKATDIMIQLQKTDQFSGSMQEHLYSRNVVITGKWLPYQSLKDEGAWFLDLNELEEIKTTLPMIIENFAEYESLTTNCPSAISNLSSWENNIKSWTKLYNV